ncbi:hypothetical protein E2320_008737 [Naja naja]|nr:hypothetical protein E2320_008737 [Naja naja]
MARQAPTLTQSEWVGYQKADSRESLECSQSPASGVEEGEVRSSNFSEDEDVSFEMPVLSGLFDHSLFKSLLHKAKNMIQLASDETSVEPRPQGQPQGGSLFSQPTLQAEVLPSPRLFMDVLKQCASPGTGLNPSSSEKKFYNAEACCCSHEQQSGAKLL